MHCIYLPNIVLFFLLFFDPISMWKHIEMGPLKLQFDSTKININSECQKW